tara:strand:+ start:13888 stop:14478 length:591 start_codon:yes stop_codon:yes gene_type:complete
MLDKKIAWERWDEDVIEQEIVEDFYSDEDGDEESIEDALNFLEKIPSLVTTPMGMFQLHDKMNILNQFDCWMGYTNFEITNSIRDTLEKVEGVELLNIMTRYRFFLGVGKMFNFSDVRRSVESLLCESEIDEYSKESVNIIKENISSDKYWAIFVTKSGEILYASTNEESDEDYLKKLKHYQKRKNKNGGSLLQND